MTMIDDDGALPAAVVAKEPWETPRVVAAAVKDSTAYTYAGNDAPHS